MDSPNLLNKFKTLEKEGKYEEIISEFTSLPDDLPTSEKHEIQYIYSKALFLKGKYLQVLEVLDKILEEHKLLDHLAAKVVHQKVVCYLAMGSFKKAEEMFEKLFSIPKIETFDVYPSVLVNFANLSFYQGKLIKAKEIYEKALREYENRKLPYDKVLNNLVLVYSQLGLYKQALETSSKVIELKEQKKDWHGWCIALVNRSIVLSHFERREEAYNCIARVLNFAEEKGWPRIVAGAYGNLASLQMRDFDEKEAEESLKKARAILEQIHGKDILAPVLSKLAYISILREEFNKAESYIQELYNLAEEQESTFTLVWSSLLETLLYWKKTRKKRWLISFLKFLHKQFDLEIHNMLFQSSFFMAYQFLLIDDAKLTKKALKMGLDTAHKFNNTLYEIKFAIALALLYLAEGKIKHSSNLMERLTELTTESKISFPILATIRDLYADFHEYNVNKKELQYQAFRELWNYIQNAIPIF